MKTFTNILMALTKRDSPLLWRGARGVAKSVNIFPVNIPNANTKNINTPTIEIVGFDMTGTSTSHLATASAPLGPSRPSPLNYLMVFKYAFTTIFGALTAVIKIECRK